LTLLLLTARSALSDPSADADKSAPNAEIVALPAEGDSQPAAEEATSSAAGTTPVTNGTPAANQKAGDSTNQADTQKPAATPVVSTSAPTANPVSGPDHPQSSAASDTNPLRTTTPPSAPSQSVATTDASAAIDPDASITEQLRNLANGKFDHIIGSTKDRTAIEAFYSGRNYALLWITEGKVNARAKAAIAYLGGVTADGLDPTDYPVPNFASLTDPVALAEAEVRLTISVITYAHHAQIGRVHWSRVSGDIFYDQSAPDPGKVLATMAAAKDAGEALDAYEPHAESYLALKAKLAEFRAGQVESPGIKNSAPSARPNRGRMRRLTGVVWAQA
jgi:murein L,D-transpeptidase YcbB/YkuD